MSDTKNYLWRKILLRAINVSLTSATLGTVAQRIPTFVSYDTEHSQDTTGWVKSGVMFRGVEHLGEVTLPLTLSALLVLQICEKLWYKSPRAPVIMDEHCVYSNDCFARAKSLIPRFPIPSLICHNRISQYF